MFDIYLKGLALGASLIMAIGLQNAFVLRQGIKNRHIMATAFTASVIDAVLIFSGVFGFGMLVVKAPALLNVLRYGGAAFLFVYGTRALLKAFKGQTLDHHDAEGLLRQEGLKETILLLLAFSLLNPHVYLDTVVLIGGLSAAQGEAGKIWFGAGAATASFLWFFSLAYGGRMLAPVFAKPVAWKILDILIALIMWGIAINLLAGMPEGP